jgi:hypothetical protein
MTVAPVGLLNARGVIREVTGGLERVLSQDENDKKLTFLFLVDSAAVVNAHGLYVPLR